MPLKYVVKKRVFGFDKTKTAKYVAAPVTAGVVDFNQLCEQVSKVGFAPRGLVKMVLDGCIDALEMNLQNGFTVKLGEFGTFRSAFGSQAKAKLDEVDSSALRRRKIIFKPGSQLRDMIQTVSIQKFALVEGEQAPAKPKPTKPDKPSAGGGDSKPATGGGSGSSDGKFQ